MPRVQSRRDRRTHWVTLPRVLPSGEYQVPFMICSSRPSGTSAMGVRVVVSTDEQGGTHAAFLEVKVQGDEQVQRPDRTTRKDELEEDAGDHANLRKAADQARVESREHHSPPAKAALMELEV